MNRRLLTSLLVISLLFLAAGNCYAANIDWIGTTSSNWTVITNWQGGVVPGSGDNARIGVAVNFTNQPNIPVNTTVSVGSITFGCDYTTTSSIILTVKSGSTLTVVGDVTMKADAYAALTAGQTNTVTITGAGNMTAVNLNVTSAYLAASSSYTQVLNTSVNSLALSGNIALTSNDDGTGTYTYNSTFIQSDNIVSLTGTLKSVNSTYATSTFTVNPSNASIYRGNITIS